MNNTIPYASFWERVGAVFIDAIVTAVPGYIVASIFSAAFSNHMALRSSDDVSVMIGTMLWAQIASIGMAWVYFAAMESSQFQGTVGKIAVGIKVVDLDGNPVTFGRASLRFLGRIISAIAFGIGFLIQPFTEKRQTLHDIMAGCLVVKRNAKFTGTVASQKPSPPPIQRSLAHMAGKVTSALGPSRGNKPPQHPIDDSPFYAAAMKECEGDAEARQASTWARAYSMMEGDENRTKAKYIELRVAELVAQEQKRQEDQRIENLKREMGAQAEQMNNAQLEFASRYAIGRHFPVLFKHFGHRVTRISVETDAGYAARLQRFARDFEKETGMKLE